jgi:hypothetical protein
MSSGGKQSLILTPFLGASALPYSILPLPASSLIPFILAPRSLESPTRVQSNP